jgi:hypothetical protein
MVLRVIVYISVVSYSMQDRVRVLFLVVFKDYVDVIVDVVCLLQLKQQMINACQK